MTEIWAPPVASINTRQVEDTLEWLVGVIGQIPVVGVVVDSLEDNGPIMHLIYELGMFDLDVRVRVGEGQGWIVSTLQNTLEADELGWVQPHYLVVHGDTLLVALAQTWEWWSTRVERRGA
jgi:hypothetical protein